MSYGDRFQEPDYCFEPECNYECVGCLDTECDNYISEDEDIEMQKYGFTDIYKYRVWVDESSDVNAL